MTLPMAIPPSPVPDLMPLHHHHRRHYQHPPPLSIHALVLPGASLLLDAGLGLPLASNAQTYSLPPTTVRRSSGCKCFVSSSSLPPSTSTFDYPPSIDHSHEHPIPVTSPPPCPPAKRARNEKWKSFLEHVAIRSLIESTRLVGWWMPTINSTLLPLSLPSPISLLPSVRSVPTGLDAVQST
jgi:hypothetical protein